MREGRQKWEADCSFSQNILETNRSRVRWLSKYDHCISICNEFGWGNVKTEYITKWERNAFPAPSLPEGQERQACWCFAKWHCSQDVSPPIITPMIMRWMGITAPTSEGWSTHQRDYRMWPTPTGRSWELDVGVAEGVTPSRTERNSGYGTFRAWGTYLGWDLIFL